MSEEYARDREVRMEEANDLDDRYDHHVPSDLKILAHDDIRNAMHSAATTVLTRCAVGRERSLALTKLEEAMFWANAGIAREEE